MPKIRLHTAFDGISGDINKINITTHKKKFDSKGNPVDGLIRSKMKKGARAIDFKRYAFKILATNWNTVSQVDKQTWINQAETESIKQSILYTGYNLFQRFYINKYISTIGLSIEPKALVSGSPNNSYQNRDTRNWISVLSVGFSIGRFGKGTFGTTR